MSYRKKVEELLRLYPFYQVSISQDMRDLLPRITASSIEMERVDGGEKEYISTTEEYGIKRAERKRLVEIIDEILSSLDEVEREIIKKTYFLKLPSTYIADKLEISERTLRNKKTEALEKIAIALNII